MKRTLAALVALGCLACGEEWTASTTTGEPPPDVAGTYSDSYSMWTLSVFRQSDGFRKAFSCAGSVTLSQRPLTRTVGSLSGFAVVGGKCEPVSFPITGTVDNAGAVTLTSDGPRPPEGPCPGGQAMVFHGDIVRGRLDALATTTVECPGLGAHSFTYHLYGYRER